MKSKQKNRKSGVMLTGGDKLLAHATQLFWERAAFL